MLFIFSEWFMLTFSCSWHYHQISLCWQARLSSQDRIPVCIKYSTSVIVHVTSYCNYLFMSLALQLLLCICEHLPERAVSHLASSNGKSHMLNDILLNFKLNIYWVEFLYWKKQTNLYVGRDTGDICSLVIFICDLVKS